MCKIFNCDKRHGSYCYYRCPMKDRCSNKCKNDPHKCGQYVEKKKMKGA